MNVQSTYPEKPSLVNVIAWTTLASGIVNLGWGLVVTAIAILSTLGIGILCCAPLTILPSILGIFEILYAVKLLGNPPQPVQPAKVIAVLEILCVLIGNVFAMVVGILSLVFYNDQIVKDFFDRLNGTLPPEPVPPAPPVPPVVPTPSAPVVEPIPSPLTGEPPVSPTAPVEESAPGEAMTGVEEILISEPEPPVTTQDETLISSLPNEEIVLEPGTSEPEPPSPSVSPLDETIISSRERPTEEPPAPESPQDTENPEQPKE